MQTIVLLQEVFGGKVLVTDFAFPLFRNVALIVLIELVLFGEGLSAGGALEVGRHLVFLLFSVLVKLESH